eukprot:gene2945-3214_t
MEMTGADNDKVEGEDDAKDDVTVGRWRAEVSNYGLVTLSDITAIQAVLDLGYGASSLWTWEEQAQEEDEENSEPVQLVLLDEEALYLLSCGQIEVFPAEGGEDLHMVKCITAEELWQRFLTKSDTFAVKYRVYSYYKDLGFTIRTAVNFGMDYCLYADHPSRCHSEACVLAVDARAGASLRHDVNNEAYYRTTATSMESESNTLWRHVSSLTRVMPDVMKVCLFCYVLPKNWNSPSTPASTEQSTPYAHLFEPVIENTCPLELSSSLLWDVRPVSVMVRRQQVNNERYLSVQALARRYHQGSKLRRMRRSKAISAIPIPGQFSNSGKQAANKRKKRVEKRQREDDGQRNKNQSRTNAIWTLLLRDSTNSSLVEKQSVASSDMEVRSEQVVEIAIQSTTTIELEDTDSLR